MEELDKTLKELATGPTFYGSHTQHIRLREYIFPIGCIA